MSERAFAPQEGSAGSQEVSGVESRYSSNPELNRAIVEDLKSIPLRADRLRYLQLLQGKLNRAPEEVLEIFEGAHSGPDVSTTEKQSQPERMLQKPSLLTEAEAEAILHDLDVLDGGRKWAEGNKELRLLASLQRQYPHLKPSAYKN